MSGKILAMFVPIFLFAALDYSHIIANFTFFGLALMLGSPMTVGEVITLNFIPTLIGNLIGGAILGIPLFVFYCSKPLYPSLTR